MQKKITSIKIILFFIILSLLLFAVDIIQIKNGHRSICTLPVIDYKDGGTVYRIGFGHGVYEWRICTKRTINGVDYSGDLVGTEIVLFPKCYFAIFSNNIRPRIALEFEEH